MLVPVACTCAAPADGYGGYPPAVASNRSAGADELRRWWAEHGAD